MSRKRAWEPGDHGGDVADTPAQSSKCRVVGCSGADGAVHGRGPQVIANLQAALTKSSLFQHLAEDALKLAASVVDGRADGESFLSWCRDAVSKVGDDVTTQQEEGARDDLERSRQAITAAFRDVAAFRPESQAAAGAAGSCPQVRMAPLSQRLGGAAPMDVVKEANNGIRGVWDPIDPCSPPASGMPPPSSEAGAGETLSHGESEASSPETLSGGGSAGELITPPQVPDLRVTAPMPPSTPGEEAGDTGPSQQPRELIGSGSRGWIVSQQACEVMDVDHIPAGGAINVPPNGQCVAYSIYAARDLLRFTRKPGRSASGYARDHKQELAEEGAVKLIVADVIRRMRLAGATERADRLQAGEIPEGGDFDFFAEHVGGQLQVVPLGCANVQGPSTFGHGSLKLVLGMLEQGGVMHVELLQTHMQGEKSRGWPSKALVIRQPHLGNIVRGDKVWELRTRCTNFRGTIALAEAGTGEIFARARIAGSIPIDEEGFLQNYEKHRVKPAEMPESLRGKSLHAWVLAEVVGEQTPFLSIPRALRQGPVGFINLPDGAEDEARREDGAGQSIREPPRPSRRVSAGGGSRLPREPDARRGSAVRRQTRGRGTEGAPRARGGVTAQGSAADDRADVCAGDVCTEEAQGLASEDERLAESLTREAERRTTRGGEAGGGASSGHGGGGGGDRGPGLQPTIAADILVPRLLNSLRGIRSRSVIASTNAPGTLGLERVDQELQVDEQAFTNHLGNLLSWNVPLRDLWCLLDTDGGYTEGERTVYRAWLQTSVLALGRGEELLELTRAPHLGGGETQGETRGDARGATQGGPRVDRRGATTPVRPGTGGGAVSPAPGSSSEQSSPFPATCSQSTPFPATYSPMAGESPHALTSSLHGFHFHSATGRTAARVPDPFEDFKQRILNFDGTPEEFLDWMLARETFAGMHRGRDVVKTIGEALDAIAKDDRPHHEIATHPDFSIGPLYPAPVVMVVKTVALAQGWSPECLAACLLSDLAFLEHPQTRLALSPGALHTVSPNIPIVIGASSSARKSSLIKFTTDLLVAGSPCDGFATRNIFLVDATLKGIRNSLANYMRASVTSDEIVNTYSTPWSEPGTGVNYLSRSKLNTFLNCERDDVITGIATTHIDGYSFQHKVAGQVSAAEWVLKPAPHGFQKRISFFLSEDRPRSHAGQECEASVSFLQDMHAWMQEGPMNTPETAILDGYARVVMNGVSAAIDNFLGEPPTPLPEALKIKLGYADTDLIRLAHVNQRFLERLLCLRWPNETPRPESLGLLSFALAIRGWLRQVHIHCAYYKYISQMLLSTASSSRGAGDGTDRDLAAAMASAPVQAPSSRLMGIERVLSHVVQKCKGDDLTSHGVNLAIRNLKYTIESPRNCREIVDDVLNRLIDGGLAEAAAQVRSRGRRVRVCRWKSWTDIRRDPASDAFRLSLGLGEDDFRGMREA